MGKDKPHPREDICKHLTSKNWYSEYLKNSYEFKIMAKRLEMKIITTIHA